MSAAQHLLDRVQSIAQLVALAGDPRAYAEALAGELADADTLAALATRDDRLRAALVAIDALVERAVRVRLEHALADDTSLGAPTRKVFASTIGSYAGRLDVLEDRARELATRGGARDPGGVAARVVAAARDALALREAVRAGVLDLVARLATAAAMAADDRARDRRLDEAARRQWSAARRDLETIAREPAAIGAAPMAARLAAWPSLIDEPAPEREATIAELLELD